MEAGVIVYRRKGDELLGRWSHVVNDGRLANEWVGGVAPGSFTGTWPVKIWHPDGHPIFEGTLESVALGESFKLSWRGTLLDEAIEATFEGIGCALDADTLCSSFELVKTPAQV
jgi:hypothetical protein